MGRGSVGHSWGAGTPKAPPHRYAYAAKSQVASLQCELKLSQNYKKDLEKIAALEGRSIFVEGYYNSIYC